MKIAIAIDLDWPYEHHYDVVRGILNYGKENDWECVIEPWLETADSIDHVPGNYDGVIGRVTPQLYDWCTKNDVPLVNVWTNSPVNNVPSTLIDVKAIGKVAADYLISRGFQNFGFLADLDDSSSNDMLEGFTERLYRKNLDCEVVWVKRPVSKEEWEVHDNTYANWTPDLHLPIAVFSSDHLLSRYFCEWCKKNDLLVPDDVAILSGLSNELICDRIEPALSNIKNKFTDLGYEAADLLRDLALGEVYRGPRLISPGELIERRSTDVEPVQDRIIARALRFIWDFSSGPIQVGDVARALDINRRSLERRFRQVLNSTVNEEILRSRISRAKKILTHSNKTVKEVAERSGFTSSQRLAQVFREQLGMSAKEFREHSRAS